MFRAVFTAVFGYHSFMSKALKTVVLTGASRGIGHATVMRFSKEGWRIITCSRDAVPVACQRDPNWAIHIPTDLGDEGSVKAFIEQANEVIERMHTVN